MVGVALDDGGVGEIVAKPAEGDREKEGGGRGEGGREGGREGEMACWRGTANVAYAFICVCLVPCCRAAPFLRRRRVLSQHLRLCVKHTRASRNLRRERTHARSHARMHASQGRRRRRRRSSFRQFFKSSAAIRMIHQSSAVKSSSPHACVDGIDPEIRRHRATKKQESLQPLSINTPCI